MNPLPVFAFLVVLCLLLEFFLIGARLTAGFPLGKFFLGTAFLQLFVPISVLTYYSIWNKLDPPSVGADSWGGTLITRQMDCLGYSFLAIVLTSLLAGIACVIRIVAYTRKCAEQDA